MGPKMLFEVKTVLIIWFHDPACFCSPYRLFFMHSPKHAGVTLISALKKKPEERLPQSIKGLSLNVLISIEILLWVCMDVPLSHTCSPVSRLVHPDGSLADLTMLSVSSVEATLPREEQEPQGEKEEEPQGEREEEKKEKEEEKDQALVVMLCDTKTSEEKPGTFSDGRQSSTDESHQCSAGDEPEPSTEQSSGKTDNNKNKSAYGAYFHFQRISP